MGPSLDLSNERISDATPARPRCHPHRDEFHDADVGRRYAAGHSHSLIVKHGNDVVGLRDAEPAPPAILNISITLPVRESGPEGIGRLAQCCQPQMPPDCSVVRGQNTDLDHAARLPDA
jgi:hypothetical protein